MISLPRRNTQYGTEPNLPRLRGARSAAVCCPQAMEFLLIHPPIQHKFLDALSRATKKLDTPARPVPKGVRRQEAFALIERHPTLDRRS